DVTFELSSGFARAGEDGRAVAVRIAVDEANGFIERCGAKDNHNRTEDLVLVDGHVGRHMIEQRRSEEEAALVAGNGQAAAVDDQPCALALARIDVAPDLLAMRSRDERTHVHAGSAARTD